MRAEPHETDTMAEDQERERQGSGKVATKSQLQFVLLGFYNQHQLRISFHCMLITFQSSKVLLFNNLILLSLLGKV